MNFTPDESVRIFLSLGSNLGDREANLVEAIRRIEALGLRVERASPIYETEPVGYTDQGWFLNQVIEVRMTAGLNRTLDAKSKTLIALCGEQGRAETVKALLAEGLLRALLEVERALGREREFANAPRTLDIDLLLFGDLVMVKDISSHTEDLGKESASTGLVVPHPRLHLRRFVLEPLNDIAQDLVHPSLHKTVADLLKACTDSNVVRLYK